MKKLNAAWRAVYKEDLETHGERAMQRYENALEALRDRLQRDATGGRRLLDALDVQPGEDPGRILLEWADMDDLPPKRVKSVLRDELEHLGGGRHELSAVLRQVLRKLFEGSTNRIPRVGPNRHWPRLLQYLRELEDETDWSPDGRGVRLVNASGRGPVASRPNDPQSLVLVIDPEYL